MSNTKIQELEAKLDDFDASVRSAALDELIKLAEAGEVKFAPESTETNVHFHTFYSYNGEGYSPGKIAWLAKKAGLGCAGTIDFDVLEAVDEFFEAADKLKLKASAGMETRVFVPEFSTREINSPGEPGVAYHMATGMTSGSVPAKQQATLASFKEKAQARNKAVIESVNEFLSPLELDYEKDLLRLVPAGNPTERHMCQAYAEKAAEVFAEDKLADFWSEKLGQDANELDLPAGPKLQGVIRSKTMKQGGVGYVQPDETSFPKMAEVNAFILECGGIPTLAWLNGLSQGEQDMEELLDVAMGSGVAAVNIIPDRNYTPGKGMDDVKCQKLYEFVEICRNRNLPIIAGTEMNSPGQKFVDDFKSKELAPLCEEFYNGAMIVYAHTQLQKAAGLGYTSDWAKSKFENVESKNQFYLELGKKLKPETCGNLSGIDSNCSPEEIMNKI